MKHNKSNIIYYFLLTIFLLNIFEISPLTFPIKFSSKSYIAFLNSKKNEEKNLNLDNIIKYIFENKITSTIYIGTPSQKMMITFSNQEYTFYLSKNPEINNDEFLNNNNMISNFMRPLSSTFILKNIMKYKTKNYNLINLGQENLSFDGKSKYNFQFLIENEKENKPVYFGIIGVSLNKDKELINYPNFFNQLYENGIINNYYWYIDYNKNKLIIGEENFSIKNNNYQEVLTKPYLDLYNDISIIDWNIVFYEVYMSQQLDQNKFIIDRNTSKPQGNLNIDCGFIIGTPRYRIFLNEKFFNQLIEENKCFSHIYKSKNKYKTDYYLYSCNKTFESEIKEKFQNLKFVSKELNYVFELNYDDLFVNINNDKSLLFMVAFEVINMNTYNYFRWILGEPFLKKYNFIFNPNKKTITFKRNEISVKKSKINFNINKKTIFIILFIIILMIIIFKIIKMYKIKLQNSFFNNKKLYLNTNANHNNNINSNNISKSQTLELKDSLLLINNNIKIENKGK